jgi:hypothetical protein
MEPLTGPPLQNNGVAITDDPPPPYPSRDRRRTLRTSRRHTRPSTDPEHFPTTASDPDINENTPLLLAPPSPHSSSQNRRPSTSFRARPRSLSHTSVASASPSLAQTVISLFQDCDPADDGAEDDADVDVDEVGVVADGEVEYDILADADRHCVHGDNHHHHHHHQEPTTVSARFSKRGWSRYFRPMRKKVYYMALFHLLVLNFPYALAAWVYLFVFTLVSTPIFHFILVFVLLLRIVFGTPFVGG